MTTSLNRLGVALIGAFAMIALAAGYWGLVARDTLRAREDNPRRVLEEQRIRRGQILDRQAEVVAAILADEETGLAARHYPYPEAAPVVGYYSLRHGVGGVEAAYDNVLRGNAWMTPSEQLLHPLLHRPQIGGDVRLTLDANVQREVDGLLGERNGAIVVLSVPEGEVLALASHPTFDPNTLDEQWETLSEDPAAPLLNRVTMGLYQPGTILQSVVLGAALEVDAAVSPDVWNSLAVSVDGGVLPCAGNPGQVGDLADAFAWACPGPFRALAESIGARELGLAFNSFGLVEAPGFDLPTTAADLAGSPTDPDPGLAAIGQGELTVTPLQMAQVAAALANHGEIPALRVAQSIREPGGLWEPLTSEGYPRGTVSRASADEVAQLMRRAVLAGAAHSAALPSVAVYGHVGLALSGPQGTLHAWFIGFTHHTDEAVAVAVLLEDEPDAAIAARLGGQVLRVALDAAP